MKVTLYRASGSPIKPEHKELYFKELSERMDELESTVGKCTSSNAEAYQVYMEDIHRNLTRKYPNKTRIQYPATAKQLKYLCTQYGAVAFCNESEELVAYIMDA